MPSEKLTLEQQFKLRVVEEQVRGLNIEQTKNLLLQVVQQIMIKDNQIKNLRELIAVQDDIIEIL